MKFKQGKSSENELIKKVKDQTDEKHAKKSKKDKFKEINK